MSKKVVKLVAALALLAGTYAFGLPKPAQAFCQPICCDPDCVSVRHCFGPGCSVCEENCSIDPS